MRDLHTSLRNYTILTLTVGILLVSSSVVLTLSDTTLDMTRFAIILFLFTCVAFTRGVPMRRGTDYITYHFWEYPAIVGLILAPAYVVVVAMMLTQAFVTFGKYFTHPKDRPRLLGEYGFLAISASIGAYLAATFPPVSYVVGFVVGAVVYDLLLYGRDLAEGDRDEARRALVSDWYKRLFPPLILSSSMTLLVVAIGPRNNFLIIAPVTLLVLYWLVKWRVGVTDDQDAWRHMESISSKFIGELEEHKAISIALEESLKLFAANRAEIVLPGTHTGDGSRWVLDEDGGGVEVEFFPFEDPALDVPAPTLDTQVIPLMAGERRYGHMVITWTKDGPDRKTRKGLANVFGHSVAASIANTRHNQHISNQAAEKAREAERDPLTGLGNRSMLSERGPALLAESADIHRSCALLLFDLDGFKRVNDTLGHAAGDRVLEEVARRIKDTTRKSDLAIRLGGDEFAVLAVDMESPADAERLASKITRALVPPVEVEDLHLSIESSIGVSIYPNDAEDIESLLKLADIAMYQAKAIGRGKTIRYSPGINHNTHESLFLATDLRRAIFSPGELVLHYQPQVDLKTNRTVGVEGLIRWHHPTLGLLYPDRFVNIAERSNLVRPFTLAILDMALADRVRMKAVIPDGTVSVNLSAQNLLDTGLALDVQRLLERYDVDATELVLEVTETTTAKDVIAADKVLNELATLGCTIAMDDFGSGYATMESMRSGSPIHEIKIDRGFIEHVLTQDRDRRVACALIEIAHAWDCRVVAEGIEDEETYLALRDMGCDIAQGYWLHRPAPLPEIMEWITAREATNDADEARAAEEAHAAALAEQSEAASGGWSQP